MSERIAIGVDAGGTATVAALSRDGTFESSLNVGPANASSLGVARAAQTIATAVRELTGDCDPDALFVAAAGAGRAGVQAELQASLAAAFPETPHVAVEDDTRASLRAAIPDGPGAVLIAGTGSIAYAECGDARVRAGGAGFLLGDEGSAFALGLGAARLLSRAYDGRGAHDETTALVARALDAHDRDALLAAFYAGPLDVARIAALAPAIVAFAGKGNRASTKLVQTAAQDLGDLLKSVVRASGLYDASPAIALAGGLLRENSLLTFLLETRIASEIPGAQLVRVRDEPVRAALRFAEALG